MLTEFQTSKRLNGAFARSRDYKQLVTAYLQLHYTRHRSRGLEPPRALGAPLSMIFRKAIEKDFPDWEWRSQTRLFKRLRQIIEDETRVVPVDEMEFPDDLDPDGFLKSVALSKFH